MDQVPKNDELVGLPTRRDDGFANDSDLSLSIFQEDFPNDMSKFFIDNQQQNQMSIEDNDGDEGSDVRKSDDGIRDDVTNQEHFSNKSKSSIHRSKGRPTKSLSSSGSSGGSARTTIQCQICNKTFNNSSALAKHKLIHSDERKYTCSQCSKSFKRQDHLNGHMMTHSSKKPYECKFKGCDKSYCDARSLRRHYENHHQQLLDSSSSVSLTGSELTLTPGLTPGASSSEGQSMFSFENALRQPRDPSYLFNGELSPGSILHQMSPISPSVNGSPTAATQHVWSVSYNPLDEPKPIKCTMCDRRFKNMPALNGHMRLHGGYTKKDLAESEKKEVTNDTTALPPVTKSLSAADLQKVTSSSGLVTSILKEETPGSYAQMGSNADDITHQQKLPCDSSPGSSVSRHLDSLEQTRTLVNRLNLVDEARSMMSDDEKWIIQTMETPSENLIFPNIDDGFNCRQTIFLNSSDNILEQDNMDDFILDSLNSRQQTAVDVSSLSVQTVCSPLQQQQQSDATEETKCFMDVPSEQISQAIKNLASMTSPINCHMENPADVNLVGQSCANGFLRNPSCPIISGISSSIMNGQHSALPRDSSAVYNQPAKTPHTPHMPLGPTQTPHTPHSPFLAKTSFSLASSQPLTPTSSNYFQFPPNVSFRENPPTSRGYRTPRSAVTPRSPFKYKSESQFTPSHPNTPNYAFQFTPNLTISEASSDCGSPYLSRHTQKGNSYHPYSMPQKTGRYPCNNHQLQQQQQFEREVMQVDQEIEQRLQHLKEEDIRKQQNIDQQTADMNFQQPSDHPIGSNMEAMSGGDGTFSQNQLAQQAYGLPDPSQFEMETELTAEACKDIESLLLTSPPLSNINFVGQDSTLLTHVDQPYQTDDVIQMLLQSPIGGQALLDIADSGTSDCSGTNMIANTSSAFQQTPALPAPSVAQTNNIQTFFFNPNQPAVAYDKTRKKHRPEPLVIPSTVSNFGFPSQLRSPKLIDSLQQKNAVPPPYTPPPMISPLRRGSGLFCMINNSNRPPQSAPAFHSTQSHYTFDISVIDAPPETAIQPHVNIGPQFQAEVPRLGGNVSNGQVMNDVKEKLMWDPKIVEGLSEKEVKFYQEFACGGHIPGNRTDREVALQLLHMCNGNIQLAKQKLINGGTNVQGPNGSNDQIGSDAWKDPEIKAYCLAFLKFDKDFNKIAREVGSKTLKQCIQFYYIWKKVWSKEYEQLRQEHAGQQSANGVQSFHYDVAQTMSQAISNNRASIYCDLH